MIWSFVGRSVPWIICCNAACLGSSEQQEELRNIQDNRPDREFCLLATPARASIRPDSRVAQRSAALT